MKTIRNIKIATAAAIVIAIIVAIIYIVHFTKNVHSGHKTEVVVTPTPVNLDSIKAIGQWSVLSVELDQVVDTVDKGFFTSHRISVGFHGTLHYGIDMAELKDGWARIENDTAAYVILPQVRLLGNAFLDERQTKVYEGRDDMDFVNKPSVKAALVRKAKAEMKRRGDEHLPEARSKAEQEMTRIFKSHGYHQVYVSFAK